jgi:uncharacterized membrane protein
MTNPVPTQCAGKRREICPLLALQAGFLLPGRADASVISRRTDGLGYRERQKSPESPGGASKWSSIWGIPAKECAARVNRAAPLVRTDQERGTKPLEGSSYALAVALSTAAGIRPFLTIAISAWMMYSGELHPSTQFQWLGSFDVATLLTAVAALEFLADKIPLVDHAMHLTHFAIKPVAAALIAGGTIPASDPQAATYLIMGASALNALGIHTGSVALRAASTSLSFGVANPIVSLVEDVLAVIGIVIAFTLPFVGLTISIIFFIVTFRMSRAVVTFIRKHALRRKQSLGS